MPADWDAILLTGGAARRMDGVDKASLTVGGHSLLDRVVAALHGARCVVAVGPRTKAAAVHLWTHEDPLGGGPAAALAAGLAQIVAPYVAVVAGDLPFLTPAAMTQLRQAVDPVTVAVAVDGHGRDQYLLAMWPTAVLRAALEAAGPLPDLPLRAVYRDVAVRRVELDGAPPPWWDCDTPAQLARARAWAEATADAQNPTLGKRDLVNLDDWMTAAAASLHLDLAALGDLGGLRTALLDLARDAAHGVARPAAPLTTFLLGVAVGRGMTVAAAATAVRRVLPEPTPDVVSPMAP